MQETFALFPGEANAVPRNVSSQYVFPVSDGNLSYDIYTHRYVSMALAGSSGLAAALDRVLGAFSMLLLSLTGLPRLICL